MLRKLSKFTLGFGLYIVLSATFMLQVRMELARILGDAALFRFLQLFFLLLVVITLYYAYQKNLKHSHILAVIWIFFAAWVLAVNQRFFTEQTHVFTYGALGYLAARDLGRAKLSLARRVGGSVLFIALVSSADEILQGFLPYRVGDMKDVLTNLLSGTLGITMGIAIQTGLPAYAGPHRPRHGAHSEGSE